MAPVTNGRVLFNSIPQDYPVPGETTVHDTSLTIDPDTVPLNGGFLVKTLVLSVDPYFRARMRKPEIKAYTPTFQYGAPLNGYGIGVVLRSETPGVEVGNHVYGPPFRPSIPELGALHISEKLPELPWTAYVGAAGMPGKTAYMGWKEFSDAKPGEIAFVSGGAGAVGSMVIQLAKQVGMKVIASAGSDAKVQYMQVIGADIAFNYRTIDTREVLAREGPIDVHVSPYPSRIECGMISGYNTGHQGIKNLSMVIGKSLHIHGILVFRLEAKYDKEFYETIPPKLVSGEIKWSEDVSKGLDKVGDVILAVQKGMNKVSMTDPEHARVDDLWFSNDTLVIKAQTKMFRVSKSILAARSTFFRDMVAFPQPADAEIELIDGSPVVPLSDSAEDVDVFLRAIFDSSYFMPPPAPIDFDHLIGILRLSHKYDIQYLHRRALKHLALRCYRASVDDWRNNVPTPATSHLTYAPGSDPVLRQLQIIAAAEEVGAQWLLPLTYYMATLHDPTRLLALIPQATSDHMIHKCLIGRTELLRGVVQVSSPFMSISDTRCKKREFCYGVRVGSLQNGLLKSVVDKNEVDALARYPAAWWDGLRPRWCSPCYEKARDSHTKALGAFWDRIPAIFGLPPWLELRAMRQEALGEEL
ncbi:hypothetical protein C8R44DRAFT_987631 [Mycena epipterygia]|nr:hypothetical protein C8R44DRAFT_987631 [Mycena epipterygia]